MTRRTADLAEGGGKPHAVQDAGANLWRPRLNTAPMELGTARQEARPTGFGFLIGCLVGWLVFSERLAEGGGKPHAVQDAGANLGRPLKGGIRGLCDVGSPPLDLHILETGIHLRQLAGGGFGGADHLMMTAAVGFEGVAL